MLGVLWMTERGHGSGDGGCGDALLGHISSLVLLVVNGGPWWSTTDKHMDHVVILCVFV